MTWTNEEIIAVLSYPCEDLPEDVLYEALKRYDDIKIALHAALQLSPDDITSLEAAAGNEYTLKFFALFLVAEKRDADAFPLIVDSFTTYGEPAWASLGNMSAVDLGRILASVCHADANALKSTIDMDHPRGFIRLACFDALSVLLCTGDIPRGTFINWCRNWLGDDILDQLEYNYLAELCLTLVINELKQDLLAVLKSGRIDTQSFTVESIEDVLSKSEMDERTRHEFSLIDDAAALIMECRLRYDVFILLNIFTRTAFDTLLPFFQQNRGITEDGKVLPEFLAGYIFVIALTPEIIMPSEWYPHLFDGKLPEFASAKDAEEAQFELVLFYNRLNSELLEERLMSPFHGMENISKNLIPLAKEWCRGMYFAMQLRLDYWLPQTGPSAFLDAITTIIAFGDDGRANDLIKSFGLQPNTAERESIWDECRIKLPDAIEILIGYAQQHAGEPDLDDCPLHSPAQSNKVGRNAPCLCGSGKKFKKCCGAPGRNSTITL